MGAYPSAVSFVLNNNEIITIKGKGKDVAPRFEVFPIAVTNELFSSDPEQVIEIENNNKCLQIEKLQKCEWEIPSSKNEKELTFGDSTNATSQYEGRCEDMPNNAINQAILDAGIRIKSNEDGTFVVATSMFPFSLYVSECEFSESFDLSIYEYKSLTTL